jgi:hypothetical protein
MKASLVRLTFLITMLISPLHFSEPGFNSTTPGCGGSNCHTSQTGILSAAVQSNLQIKITLSGTTGNVAGELVDAAGNVVAVINKTSSNPFTLTAPSAGTYKVNAGYKNPARRWDSTTITIVLADIGNNLMEATPHSYNLENNYPNPFNPSTKISWQSPVSGWQTLKVYDLLGNLVATLIDEYKPAGNYEVEFNTDSHSGKVRNLPSGVYFYQLNCGSFSETKKMLLLK